MHISGRRIGGLAAALSMLVTPLAAFAVITAAPASASSPLDNTDPKATGCWDHSASPIIQRTDSYGNTLQLWWSNDCKTNWAQIDYTGSTKFDVFLWTETQDGRRTSVFSFSGYDGWAWSNQLYAPTTNARACEQEYIPQFRHWGEVSCVGQY